VGIAVGEVGRRVHPDAFEQRVDALASLTDADIRVCLFDRRGEDVDDLLVRIQRTPGILVDNLERRPDLAERDVDLAGLVLGRPDILAAVADRPAGGSLEPDSSLSERRLSTAALADEHEDVVFLDVQRDAVDRLDGLWLLEEVQQPLVLLEVDFDVVEREERRVRLALAVRLGYFRLAHEVSSVFATVDSASTASKFSVIFSLAASQWWQAVIWSDPVS
jgi:hypothetical protein